MQEWEKKKIKNTLLECTHDLNYLEGILKNDDASKEAKEYARRNIAEVKKIMSQIKAEIATWN